VAETSVFASSKTLIDFVNCLAERVYITAETLAFLNISCARFLGSTSPIAVVTRRA
jgi:hypothetical protein